MCYTHPIIVYHIISYHIISYHIISYYIIVYHIISCYIILYHVISYNTIVYHIISKYVVLYCIPEAARRRADAAIRPGGAAPRARGGGRHKGIAPVGGSEPAAASREMGGASRNPAPSNYLLVWIVKPSGCHCTDALGGRKENRRLPTPLRSTSPFSAALRPAPASPSRAPPSEPPRGIERLGEHLTDWGKGYAQSTYQEFPYYESLSQTFRETPYKNRRT